ncbi:MAG TPA: FAD-dependent oxidoreductase [Methylobacter sp.]|jgi:ferredoxin-NADP reductase
MARYKIKLKHHELVAEGTMAFHFERPADFKFKAGQAVGITLIAPSETDAEGNTRAFSIVSAPFEDELVVATRLRDTAFKRELSRLLPGSTVKLAGPFGSFGLPDSPEKTAVFLAGGIGITPFVSMLRQATHEQLPHRLFLFYSNRRPEDAAFLDDLQRLEETNPNYRLIGTMTAMQNSKQAWAGETGHICAELLSKAIGQINSPVYYIAGPPTMVATLREMLKEVGVDDDDIRTEEFSGY